MMILIVQLPQTFLRSITAGFDDLMSIPGAITGMLCLLLNVDLMFLNLEIFEAHGNRRHIRQSHLR
jgi:hypothetical protein